MTNIVPKPGAFIMRAFRTRSSFAAASTPMRPTATLTRPLSIWLSGARGGVGLGEDDGHGPEDVGQRDGVADVQVALEVALEALHRGEGLWVLHGVAVAPLHDDDERLDAAELLVDVPVRHVVRGVLE